ncbi:MAG: tyrosinase family protein [Verrucomicrobiales bacterium]
MKSINPCKLSILFSVATALLLPSSPAQDAYVRDNITDDGTEPNPHTGAMYQSPDIWVRTNPDPDWVPYPHPTASPTWTPQPHQNPEYRERDYAQPNYVYVRVTNRDSTATDGTERLRVYWAKAGTGLGWPHEWTGAPGNSDADTYYANDCGVWRVFGKEITKPRKEGNSATADEKQIYADAVAALDSAVHPGSSGTYFDLQDMIHSSGHAQHFNDSFVAWHREYLNRYEQALLKQDPRVTLLYWDWNRPAPTNGDYDFLGQFGTSSWYDTIQGAPPSAVAVGSPFDTFVPAITRGPFNTQLQTMFKSDATVLLASDYGQFAYIGGAAPGGGGFNLDGDVQSNPHNLAHISTGTVFQDPDPAGNQLDNRGANLAGNFNQAAEDPFFFMLHGNVDRLWAQWQRDQSLSGYNLNRLDTATAYNGASNTDLEFNNLGNVVTNTNGGLTELSGTIGPWDGIGAGIAPWTSAGGYVNVKPYNHASVVSPPIYDTAPLYVPALQPGESVIVQIPWYPPNPDDFDCFGTNGSQGHFCLLARIETEVPSPYGMTFPEGNGLGTNVRNNNNIAWKNLTVVDDFSGLGLTGIVGGIVIRNINRLRAVLVTLNFNVTGPDGQDYPFNEVGTMTVDIPREMFQRWQQAGGKAEGVEIIDDRGTVRILSPRAQMFDFPLAAGEFFGITPQFQLGKNRHNATQRRFRLDVQQLQDDQVVGGNTYDIDFNKIRLVKPGSRWAYHDLGVAAGKGWNTADFDDGSWKVGNANFGYEPGDAQAKYSTRLRTFDDLRNRLEHGPGLHDSLKLTKPRVTTYFRRNFQSAGGEAYRTLTVRTNADDGVVVYLNGTVIYRSGLPRGDINYKTYGQPVEGALENAYVTFDVTQYLALLKPGDNVIAAELHQAEGSYDAAFDLELFADGPERLDTPPVVAINLHDSVHCIVGGTMCSARSEEAIRVIVDAVDDREIVATRFYLNGQLFKETQGNRIDTQFFSRGLHNNGALVLRAEAVDDAGNIGSVERKIHFVDNMPPLVTIKSLGKRPIAREGTTLDIQVNAEDIDGEVAAVRFFYKSCASSLGVPAALFAEVNVPPYAATAKNLHAGAQIITVQVEDNDGAIVEESVTVLGARYPDLVVEATPPNGAISISWDGSVLQSARLQSSTDFVNWTDVNNSRTPFQVSTGEGSANYYRLTYDLNEATSLIGFDVGPISFDVGPVNINPGGGGVVVDPGGGGVVVDPGGGGINVDIGPIVGGGGQPGGNNPIVGAAVAADKWQLPGRDGNVQSLEDFRGEPLVMLFFLGHECLVCLEQLEAMKAAHSAFENAGVNVVALSPDTVEDLGKMQDFPFALLSDADLSVFGSYGITDSDGDPTHAVVIIDGGGQVVLRELSDLPDMNLGRILAVAKPRPSGPDQHRKVPKVAQRQ